MGSKFVYAIPGGLHRPEEMLRLKDWVEQTGKPVEISVYDTVFGLQWNGGRPMVGAQAEKPFALHVEDIPEAVARARRLNEADISVSLTFNSTMNAVDVDNEEGNYFLAALHSAQNSVTVSTEMLRQHIARTYPNYGLTASICHCLTKPEDYSPLFDRYGLVVAMPVIAYQPEGLKQLPLDRLSFIVNDNCWLFCARKPHYDTISRGHMSGNSTYHRQAMNMVDSGCHVIDRQLGPKMRTLVDPAMVKRVDAFRRTDLLDTEVPTERVGSCKVDGRYNITPKMRRRLMELGVRNFKLQGRDFMPEQYQREVIDYFKQLVLEDH